MLLISHQFDLGFIYQYVFSLSIYRLGISLFCTIVEIYINTFSQFPKLVFFLAIECYCFLVCYFHIGLNKERKKTFEPLTNNLQQMHLLISEEIFCLAFSWKPESGMGFLLKYSSASIVHIGRV